jgi:catechol 2,3-dioxygenase-like lactoylglutathione lyase family enzyme
MPDSTPRTLGAHHVGLTVPDIAAAEAFFVQALGFSVVGGNPDYPATFVSDGQLMITLWQAKHPGAAVAFDRHCNLGLHHLALRVADGDALDALHQDFLGRDDVRIEFAPESLRAGPTRHMMCRIPGDLRVEFIAPAA